MGWSLLKKINHSVFYSVKGFLSFCRIPLHGLQRTSHESVMPTCVVHTDGSESTCGLRTESTLAEILERLALS